MTIPKNVKMKNPAVIQSRFVAWLENESDIHPIEHPYVRVSHCSLVIDGSFTRESLAKLAELVEEDNAAAQAANRALACEMHAGTPLAGLCGAGHAAGSQPNAPQTKAQAAQEA